VELGRAIPKDDEEYAMKVADSYEMQVGPWLSLNAIVGNIYTGSLFLALIDYLRKGDPAREGRGVSMFSYGSGCGAAFCFGAVAQGASRHAARLDPAGELDARRRLGVEEYEEILAACDRADSNDGEHLAPSQWQLRGDLFYVGTRNHIRQYYP
jgi:hydroxymethylglutaryl-CoA synthase